MSCPSQRLLVVGGWNQYQQQQRLAAFVSVVGAVFFLGITRVHGNELHPDVRQVINVVGGVNPGGIYWADSYSVGNRCYCDISTFDHGIGTFMVETPIGWRSVQDICALLGPGPGVDGRPVYNDVQCGNGPPNDATDEHVCPGRTDMGPEGCGHIGPKWHFDDVGGSNNNNNNAHPDIVAIVEGVVGIDDPGGIASSDSYSVGDDCYCRSNYDHGIANFVVETPLGWLTILYVCDQLGPGPGWQDGYPVYNDIQCGNGPPNDAGDEHVCPGRTDIGKEGCRHIGPRWNFSKLLTSTPATQSPTTSTTPSMAPSGGQEETTASPTTLSASSGSSQPPTTSTPSMASSSGGQEEVTASPTTSSAPHGSHLLYSGLLSLLVAFHFLV